MSHTAWRMVIGSFVMWHDFLQQHLPQPHRQGQLLGAVPQHQGHVGGWQLQALRPLHLPGLHAATTATAFLPGTFSAGYALPLLTARLSQGLLPHCVSRSLWCLRTGAQAATQPRARLLTWKKYPLNLRTELERGPNWEPHRRDLGLPSASCTYLVHFVNGRQWRGSLSPRTWSKNPSLGRSKGHAFQGCNLVSTPGAGIWIVGESQDFTLTCAVKNSSF